MGFRNVEVYSVSSPVAEGDYCIISMSYEYQGDAASEQLYCAIGNKKTLYFDEVLYGTSTRSIPACSSYTKMYRSVMIKITDALDPDGSPYDVYGKIGGVISDYAIGVVEVEGSLEPEFQNMVISSITSPVEEGDRCAVKCSFQYKGPAQSVELYAAIGNKNSLYFDEIIADSVDKSISSDYSSWTTFSWTIYLDITDDISPGTYDAYFKIIDSSGTHISSYSLNTVVVEEAEPEYPSSDWQNLQILSYPTSELESGDSASIKVSFQYQGPGTTRTVRVAIGNNGTFGFDEILYKEATISCPAAYSWNTITATLVINITDAIDPGTYDLYAKVGGTIPDDTDYVNNVIVIAEVEPEYPDSDWQNLQILSYPTSELESGDSASIKVSFQYQGPGTSRTVRVAIGNNGTFGFDEILYKEATISCPAAYSWTTITATLAISIMDAIDAGTYDLYAKVGGTIPDDTDYVNNVIVIGSEYPDDAWRNLDIISYPSTVQSGGAAAITVQFQYQGPGTTKTIHVAIGTNGSLGFDEILNKEETITMPAAESWTTLTETLNISITDSIDSDDSPYDIYAKIGGLIPEDEDIVEDVITIDAGVPSDPQYSNLKIISVSSPVDQGDICNMVVSFDYRGPATSEIIYGAIGKKGTISFDEILFEKLIIELAESEDYQSIECTIPIEITDSIDAGTYDAYFKFGSGLVPVEISEYYIDCLEVNGLTTDIRGLSVTGYTTPIALAGTCWIECSFEYIGPAVNLQLYGAIGISGITFDEKSYGTIDISIEKCLEWTQQTVKIPVYVDINYGIIASDIPYDCYVKCIDPELISEYVTGVITVVQEGEVDGNISGQIQDVQPVTFNYADPLILNVKFVAIDDNAWQQINGWWTRVRIELGDITGEAIQDIHMGRDYSDTVEVVIGTMPAKNLTGTVYVDGAPGDLLENPLSPTPPESGWYTISTKEIEISVTGVDDGGDTNTSNDWGLLAAAGLGLMALAGGGSSGKKTTTRRKTSSKK